jgi:hypothetical protein
VGIDMMIPFGVLTALVVYFIYTRNAFEKKVLEDFEQKFDEWKKHSEMDEKREVECKMLVGLVYEQNRKLTIQTLDKNVDDRLERGKFKVEE